MKEALDSLDSYLPQLENAPEQIALQRGIFPYGNGGDWQRLWDKVEAQQQAKVGWIRRSLQDDSNQIPALLQRESTAMASILAKQSLAILEIAQGAYDSDPTGTLQSGYTGRFHLWYCCEIQQLEALLERNGLLGDPKFASKTQTYKNLVNACRFLELRTELDPGQLLSEAEYRKRFGGQLGHIGRLLAVATLASRANFEFEVTLRAKLREIRQYQRLIQRSKTLQVARLSPSGKLITQKTGRPPKLK